jgi:hypothetical protein
MLFGFTLIAIFYYLGKVNNQKKDTLKEFLEFMEGPNQILNLMERFADELKPFVNKMPLAILKGWFSESLLKYGEDTQALRQELRSNYHRLRSSFEEIAGSVKFDAYRLIFLFSLGLFLCFIGLFYTAIGYGGSVWFYIALVLISITSAMYSLLPPGTGYKPYQTT